MTLPAQRTAGIHLARHGETEYNRLRRFQGWLPVPLNDRGREQARELAERAAGLGFAELWCSPLARARETAAIVGQRIGLEALVDERFAETDAGEWTDRTFADVQAHDPERFAGFVSGDPEFAFPGGESFAAHADRVLEGLAALAGRPRPLLVICHGVVIRLTLARLGLSLNGSDAPGSTPISNGGLVSLEPAGGHAAGGRARPA